MKQSWGSPKIRRLSAEQLLPPLLRMDSRRKEFSGRTWNSSEGEKCQMWREFCYKHLFLCVKYSNRLKQINIRFICFHQATSIASIFTVTDAPSLCHRTTKLFHSTIPSVQIHACEGVHASQNIGMSDFTKRKKGATFSMLAILLLKMPSSTGKIYTLAWWSGILHIALSKDPEIQTPNHQLQYSLVTCQPKESHWFTSLPAKKNKKKARSSTPCSIKLCFSSKTFLAEFRDLSCSGQRFYGFTLSQFRPKFLSFQILQTWQ